jgi:hypothetical protein
MSEQLLQQLIDERSQRITLHFSFLLQQKVYFMQYYMDSEFSQHARFTALVNCVQASVQCLNFPKITGWDHPWFATEKYLQTEWEG